jgi:hypothetical protein
MTTASPLNVFGTLCFLCSTFLYPSVDRQQLELTAAFNYTTLQRSVTSSNGEPQTGINYNAADETPHGLLAEAAWFKPAPAGQGAGTPAFELRAGIMEANSHTESLITQVGHQDYVQGSATGRFEPVAILVRIPLGGHGSVEAGLERPYYRSKGIVVTGFPLYANPSGRDFLVDTRSASLGYRFRGTGWEAAAAFLYATTSNQDATEAGYFRDSGSIYGGQLELNRRFGKLDLSVRGAVQRGSLSVTEGFQPAFDVVQYHRDFTREFGGAKARTSFGKAFFVAWVDGTHTQAPFWDSLAPAIQETVLHDSGLQHDFHTTDFVFGLCGELWIGRNLTIRGFGTRRAGSETVTFDATTVNPQSVSLKIRRSGWSAGIGFRVLAEP